MTMSHEGLAFLESSCSRGRQLCFGDWPRLWSGEIKKIWESVCFKGDESRGQPYAAGSTWPGNPLAKWRVHLSNTDPVWRHLSSVFLPLRLLLVISSPIPGRWAPTLASNGFHVFSPCSLSGSPLRTLAFLVFGHVVCCLAAMLPALAFKSLFLPTVLLKPTNLWSWWASLLLQLLANWFLRNKKYNEPTYAHIHSQTLNVPIFLE